ncbi:hypothetical protein LT679_00470 [Mucilaginibacter roseus]|uniref:IrrE N-terminal-like domain-containing protein n=1 Tax=Mucilaginibacter roseus TaxID=1528868 RepID=A0ABS8TZZ2_9SPHI|nr:hypothetical protein [Mucilaginibacter roseus]MCD8739059.1 hypothetical protein [Mucilaginibacter roseus]
MPFSRLEQTPFNKVNNRPLLFTGLKDRKSPLEVVWSILHEYGHILQGTPNLDEILRKGDAEQVREKDALDKAQELMERDPALHVHAADFMRFRDALLHSCSKNS